MEGKVISGWVKLSEYRQNNTQGNTICQRYDDRRRKKKSVGMRISEHTKEIYMKGMWNMSGINKNVKKK